MQKKLNLTSLINRIDAHLLQDTVDLGEAGDGSDVGQGDGSDGGISSAV